MDISGIKFPRTVQEILHDYQQGILKSEPREQSSGLCRKVDNNSLLSTISGIFLAQSFQYIV